MRFCIGFRPNSTRNYESSRKQNAFNFDNVEQSAELRANGESYTSARVIDPQTTGHLEVASDRPEDSIKSAVCNTDYSWRNFQLKINIEKCKLL